MIGFIYRQRWAVWIICKINSYTQKSSVARIFWPCKRLWYPYCVLFSQQPSSVQRDFFARDLFDCPRPARSHNTLLVGPEKMKLICKGTTLQHQEWMPEIILFIVHPQLESVHSQSFYCLINQEPSRQICQLWSKIVRGSIRTQSVLFCPMIPISKTNPKSEYLSRPPQILYLDMGKKYPLYPLASKDGLKVD